MTCWRSESPSQFQGLHLVYGCRYFSWLRGLSNRPSSVKFFINTRSVCSGRKCATETVGRFDMDIDGLFHTRLKPPVDLKQERSKSTGNSGRVTIVHDRLCCFCCDAVYFSQKTRSVNGASASMPTARSQIPSG